MFSVFLNTNMKFNSIVLAFFYRGHSKNYIPFNFSIFVKVIHLELF